MNLRQQILNTGLLEDDWDSYGAKAPSEKTILKALRILAVIGEDTEGKAYATGESICIDYERNKLKFFWETDDGGTALMIKGYGDKTIFLDIEYNDLEL